MTFLNNLLLLGLIGIAIPILIHLFNRRRAKVVEWGAMQFLMGSIVNRRRKVLIEELILMVLRCLLIAIIVLMLARPFAPVGASLAWGLLLPGLLLVALLAAVAAIMARSRLARALTYSGAVALAIGLIALSSSQQQWHEKLWGSDRSQDLVVILDGSSSMQVSVAGQTNWERAVDEFRTLLGELPNDTHVSLLVAGSTTRIVTPVPLDVRSDWNGILESLTPQEGSLDPIEAISTAVTVLQQGDYAGKRVVLIGDGQNHSWHVGEPQRWEYLAQRLKSLPTRPKVVARYLPLPESFRNASVASLELSRDLVGVGQFATLRIRVENTGDALLPSSGMQVQFDDSDAESLEVPELAAGQSVQLELPHRFQNAGAQLISARWLGQDDLAADDQRSMVVPVKNRLPVLLVDGSGSRRFLDQASAFVEIALAPSLEEGDGPSDANLSLDRSFVDVTTYAAADLPLDINFDDFEVVFLCDVARLGAEPSQRLLDYVEAGGGLVVAPGSRIDTSFYEQWQSADGRPLIPGRFIEQVVAASNDTPSRPAVDSFQAPALKRLLSAGNNDLGQVDVRAYWKVKPHEASGASVGARFDLGDALLVEQPFGRGKVSLLATALDDRASLLPSSISFLPLVHELTYAVSSAADIELNRQGRPVQTIELPVDRSLSTAMNANVEEAVSEQSKDEQPQTVPVTSESNDPSSDLIRMSQVIGPSQQTTQARWELRDGFVSLSIVGLSEPGIHRVQVPALFQQQVPLTQKSPSEADSASLPTAMPIAIHLDPAETHLVPLSTEDQEAARKTLDHFVAADLDQLIAAVIGDVPGHEIWKLLAIGAVLLMVAETFATRWIARRRKLGETQEVSFVSEGERLSTFKDRAQEFLQTVRK